MKKTRSTKLITGASLLAAGLFMSAAATAQTTTIFYDDFSGNQGDKLGGNAPTTGSGTWTAASYVIYGGNNTLKPRVSADGSARSTSYLSTSLSAGNVYELSVTMFADSPETASTQFAGFGFFSNVNAPWSSFNSQTESPTTPWMNMLTQSTTNEGDMYLKPLGENVDGYSEIDSTFDVTTARNYKLVLNTSDTDSGTAGDQYSLSLFVDDVQYGSTYTYSVAESAGLLEDIVGVGMTASLAADGAGVNYRDFLFTSTPAIPEPSTYAMLAGLTVLGIVALRRRSKKA